MARKEIHSEDLPAVEQRAAIKDDANEYEGDVIQADKAPTVDYLDELAFMEEPVTIRLEPSSDANAATAFPVWCNGKRAEVFQQGRWDEIGYLPVGRVLVVRRKILEIIIRAKVDTVHTKVQEMDSERPNNVIQRFTSPVHSFSIISDPNPRGPQWVAELRRRNL